MAVVGVGALTGPIAVGREGFGPLLAADSELAAYWYTRKGALQLTAWGFG